MLMLILLFFPHFWTPQTGEDRFAIFAIPIQTCKTFFPQGRVAAGSTSLAALVFTRTRRITVASAQPFSFGESETFANDCSGLGIYRRRRRQTVNARVAA
jgi:hypothetical protein